MFDLTILSAALGSAKAILDLLKNANDAQLAVKISMEVANVQGRLIDVQQQVLTIQSENQALRDEIKRMKAASEDETSFNFFDGVYWKAYEVQIEDEDMEGNRISELRFHGPFCPLCKDADGKAVRLKKAGSMQTGPNLVWACEIHKTKYQAPIVPSLRP